MAEEKPTIKLIPLENIVVYTSTQESYNQLMRIYECGGWEWYEGKLPTELNLWKNYRNETCVDAGIFGVNEDEKVEGKFGGKHIDFFKRFDKEIIHTGDFYARQDPPITQEMLDEINKWFDENPKIE